jgi:hypothetical protein
MRRDSAPGRVNADLANHVIYPIITDLAEPGGRDNLNCRGCADLAIEDLTTQAGTH